MGADKAADRRNLASPLTGGKRVVQHIIEVVGALHCQRCCKTRRIIGIAAHRDINGDNRLAGRFQQTVVKTASGLRSCRSEKIPLESFSYRVLDDLCLRGRTEVRIEYFEFEAVFLCRSFETF